MSWKVKMLALLACAGMLGAAPLQGVTPTSNPKDHSYQSIIDRNPFGLKPPPPPAPPPPAQTNPASSEIVLTGIASVVKPTQVYLMRKEAGKKDPSYYNLSQGQVKDGIEILQIDEKARSVKIRNAGLETSLTFATHGVKPPAGAPLPQPPAPGTAGAPVPGGVPPVPPQPGAPAPMAHVQPVNPAFGGTTPAASPFSPTSSGIRTIPSRTLRAQPETYLAPGQAALGVGTPGQVGLGGGSSSSSTPATQQSLPQNTLSREEQYLLMRANEMAQEQRYQQGLGPKFPPMPPMPEPVIPGAGTQPK